MTDRTSEQRLLDVIKKAQGKARLKKDLKIFTKINIALIALIIAVLVIFLLDIVTFDYDMAELDIVLPEESGESLIAVDDLDEDAFEEIGTVAAREMPSASKEELVKDLNLLGVVTGDDNQAIIEDKKASNTFMVYEGDEFKGFTVHDIKEGVVILDYKGKKIKLTM